MLQVRCQVLHVQLEVWQLAAAVSLLQKLG